MKPKTKERLDFNIHDALANLSTIADMEISESAPIGIVRKHRLVIQDEDFSYRTIDWILPDSASDVLDHVKETYLVILEYIQDIYEKDYIEWSDEKCKKGFQAIMVMAAEAAHKLDEYLELLPKEPHLDKIIDSQEYKDLQKFYKEKIEKKFHDELEGEKPWKTQWKENSDAILLDIDKSGLKDFDTVKYDREYELFYMKDSQEDPFFSSELYRNIKLVCDYDEERNADITEDPLLQIHHFVDKDLQRSAKQILNNCQNIISEYFSLKIVKRKDSLAALVNEAIFALMLASNEKNLIDEQGVKNSFKYFNDFQNFLRNILNDEKYQKMLAYPHDYDDKESKLLIELVRSLCKNLFYRKGGVKEEMTGYIHHLARLGHEKSERKSKKESFWAEMLENDENIRYFLSLFPNGPLLKLLDLIREEKNVGFDPIMQENIPSLIYTIEYDKNKKIEVIRHPSPTSQEIVSKAILIDEFRGFIRSLKEDFKHLIINFQDRTSWKEFSRCKAIEDMQYRVDFKKKLRVVTLNKDTDFYHQRALFLNLNRADYFISHLKQQLLLEDCGFFIFKSKENREIIEKFIDKMADVIHHNLFNKKNMLTRKERMDFIEIFYQFLILKIIEMTSPASISFMSKDSIDVGSIEAATFYAFIKLLKEVKWDKKSQDFMYWLAYSPALMIRERAVDEQRLSRALSSLSLFDMEMLMHKPKILKAVSTLYDISFLKGLDVID